MASCGKLPLVLETCLCCGAGVKFTRGWTWVNPALLFKDKPCGKAETVVIGNTKAQAKCLACPLGSPPEKAGLLWVGAQFYKTPEDWIDEARRLGVSRRIHSLPKGFEVGKHWVLVGHVHLQKDSEGKWQRGVFHVFKPTAVEYVVKGDETPEQVAKLAHRGITPVVVKREGDLGL